MATDRWACRSARMLLRACWLSLSLCCIGLGGGLVWGWPLRLEWLAATALACIGVALALTLGRRMRPAEAARRLDRRFGLDEQLATAVEIGAANPQPGTVGSHLLLQANRTARALRQQIRRRQRTPWLELLTLLALALAAAGLFVLSGIGAPWLSGEAAALPPLPHAADPADLFDEPPEPAAGEQGLPGEGDALVPGGEELQLGESAAPGQQGQAAGAEPGAGTQASPISPGEQRSLEALADALRDQGATRPAAEALDRGDPATAAQELRELADQAGQLSEAARDDLADRMREAASEIERTNPPMADQLRDSASGMEGSSQEASQALDDLAQALDEMGQGGEQGAGQQGQAGEQAGPAQEGAAGQGEQAGPANESQPGGGAGSAPGGEQRPVQPERLGVDGQPLDLTAEGGGQQGAQPARPGTTVPGGSGSTGGGDPQDVGAIGPDPLRIPLDERDVVQEYFNP
jgi:hypothetical protein